MHSSIKRIVTGIIVTLGAAMALALIPLLLVVAVPGLGRFVLGQALVRGGRLAHLDVRFERIEGDILRNVSVVGLTVKSGPDSLKVRKVTLTYDPVTSVVKQAFSISAARLVEPKVYVSTSRPKAPAPETRTRPRYPDMRVGQLRVLGGAVFLDTAKRFDSLDLTLGLVSTEPQIALQVIAAKASLVRESIAVRNLSAYARLTPDSLIVTQFMVLTRASRLQAGMKLAFEPSGIAAELQDVSIDLPEWNRFLPPGVGPIPGRVRVSGKAGVDKSALSGWMDYRAEGLAWSSVEIPPVAGRAELKDSILTVSLAGSNPELGGASIAGRLDLRRLDYSGRVELYNVSVRKFDLALPDFRLTAGADIAGRALDSVSAAISATIPDLGIDSLSATGTYITARQEARLEALRLRGPVGTFGASGTLVRDRVDAELVMAGMDLGVLRRFTPIQLNGRASGAMGVTGTIDTVNISGALDVESLNVASVDVRRGHADVALAFGRELGGIVAIRADSIRVGSVLVHSAQIAWRERVFELDLLRPGAHVHSTGEARVFRDGVRASLATLRVEAGQETVQVADPLQMAMHGESLLVHVEQNGLAGSDLRLDLFVLSGKLALADMELKGLDLARVRQFFHMDVEASGTVGLTLTGSDTLEIGLGIDGLAVPVADLNLARVDGRLRVSPDMAFIDHLWLVNAESGVAPETSVVSGSIGFSTDSAFTMRDADIKARLRNPGPWVVAYLKPILELQRGAVFGEITLKGDPLVPRLDGRVRISRATLAVPIIGATFDRVNAELVFNKNRVNIEKLSGRSGQGTTIVSGFVDLGKMWQVDSLRFGGQFTGTTINPQPELYAVLDGNLELSWAMGKPFSLAGTADVQEALVAYGFGQSSGPAPAGPDTTFVFDIHVRGDRDIWLRNQMADIELAGDLYVRKTRDEMFLSGELASRQGTIYYLDHTLRVTNGTIRFENINTINPDLDITAELPIRPGTNGAELPDKVVLSMTGTLEKPTFGFRSEPAGWSEIDIASYLNLNVTPNQLSALEQKDAVNKLLSERLLGYFQTQVSKRARGFVNLDYLQFESGLLGSGDAKVTVGKYIGRNLYVSYTQPFSGSFVPLFRVEYYINRRNQIVAESKEQSQQNLYSLRYLFKLRY
jgi:autotransporter translocation and assembly factor TamB